MCTLVTKAFWEKAKKDNKQKEISSDTFIEFIAMDIRLS
jgi:hypothetical protein